MITEQFYQNTSYSDVKKHTEGNRRSCVSTNMFLTKRFGEHEWFKYLPTFPSCLASTIYDSSSPKNL